MPRHSNHSCGQNGIVSYSHGDNSHERYSMTLIEAVSELVDADPTETPLYLNDHLDLDALDRLFNSMERAGSFNFTYGDYNINCSAEGEITITGCDVCHERGHTENPTSMRMTTEIEAPKADD